MKTITNILVRAKALIDTPDKWYQGGACDEKGSRLCALAALCNVRSTKEQFQLTHFAFRTANGIESVPRYNDSHTHAEVMAAFDRAIAVEESRP